MNFGRRMASSMSHQKSLVESRQKVYWVSYLQYKYTICLISVHNGNDCLQGPARAAVSRGASASARRARAGATLLQGEDEDVRAGVGRTVHAQGQGTWTHVLATDRRHASPAPRTTRLKLTHTSVSFLSLTRVRVISSKLHRAWQVTCDQSFTSRPSWGMSEHIACVSRFRNSNNWTLLFRRLRYRGHNEILMLYIKLSGKWKSIKWRYIYIFLYYKTREGYRCFKIYYRNNIRHVWQNYKWLLRCSS